MEQRPNGSLTLRWFVQSTLGVLLVVLLGVHLIVNHWVAPEGLLRYADIIRYYGVPGIAWMEIIFLIVVTAHCLMGMHAILLDLRLSTRAMRSLTWMLFTAGSIIVMYGAWLTWRVKTL
jgi:succinate dehydrogenase/fumarate reductase cytochrome b subunit